jgi:uncharacterized protein (TIGR03083 family)
MPLGEKETSMTTPADTDLQPTVTHEFLALADVLDAIPDARWDTPSLCAGWRIREVVAHVTMPVRYSVEEFLAELSECGGDFTRLSNVVAARDAELPTEALVAGLRDGRLHAWTPPGGGQRGALNHVVIHGLDVTVPLGYEREPDSALMAVLDDLAAGGTHRHFGIDLTNVGLEATDADWRFGSGEPIRGTVEDLALFLTGRSRPHRAESRSA